MGVRDGGGLRDTRTFHETLKYYYWYWSGEGDGGGEGNTYLQMGGI